MNLQDLKYLVAVAEHRHFGRAAVACSVSQPTLSSQIRKLEETLGVKLLERTNKRVDLTPVGGQILSHAQMALAQTREMETVARAARDPLIGSLRLGVIPTLAPYLMPLILRPMRQAYPGLMLELWEDQTHALIEGIRGHRLDAALLATPAAAPEITEIELFREPLLAALPPRHKFSRANPCRRKRWPVSCWCSPKATASPTRRLPPAGSVPARHAAHCKAECRRRLSKPSSISSQPAMELR